MATVTMAGQDEGRAARATERELHGLHLALKTCRTQKEALERQLAETTLSLQSQLAETLTERDALQLRLEAAQNQLRAHIDRESREAR